MNLKKMNLNGFERKIRWKCGYLFKRKIM